MPILAQRPMKKRKWVQGTYVTKEKRVRRTGLLTFVNEKYPSPEEHTLMGKSLNFIKMVVWNITFNGEVGTFYIFIFLFLIRLFSQTKNKFTLVSIHCLDHMTKSMRFKLDTNFTKVNILCIRIHSILLIQSYSRVTFIREKCF